MTTILVVNGPNLERLGQRDPDIYGDMTLAELEEAIREYADEDVELEFVQSNIEGELVTFINERAGDIDGIIINPAGLTRVGFSLLDACIDSDAPFVEVHLSNIYARESWRSPSIFAPEAVATIAGLGSLGYKTALTMLTILAEELDLSLEGIEED